MKRIVILALEGSVATTVTGPVDVFSLTERAWRRWGGGSGEPPRFRVELVGRDGGPVAMDNGLRLLPARAALPREAADLVMVPAFAAPMARTLALHPWLPGWLRIQHARGAEISAACSGAAFLAEAGLLDRRAATTHWADVVDFRRLYPHVRLMPDRLITDDGGIYCTGASNASWDLALYLVEKYYGREMAAHGRRYLLVEGARYSQAPFAVLDWTGDHQDAAVLMAQQEMRRAFASPLRLDDLARGSGMSRRTFIRRFVKAAGMPPMAFLRRVRIERAKTLLDSPSLSVEQVAERVGWADSGTFRRAFKEMVGLAPSDYRKRMLTRE